MASRFSDFLGNQVNGRRLSRGALPGRQEELAAAAEAMELRCVIAVVRHSDRAPKQKMKMVVTQARAVRREPVRISPCAF